MYQFYLLVPKVWHHSRCPCLFEPKINMLRHSVEDYYCAKFQVIEGFSFCQTNTHTHILIVTEWLQYLHCHTMSSAWIITVTGGSFNSGFLHSSFLKLTVIKLWKLVHICWSYYKFKSGLLYRDTMYVHVSALTEKAHLFLQSFLYIVFLWQLKGSVKEPNISIYFFFPPITPWSSISDVLFTIGR